MAVYDGPPRGGSRGGKDQFDWDTVKADKDRENYLGHSVMAPVGRWQKGKDLTWYTKGPAAAKDDRLKAEIAAVKKQEQEAMAIALGLKKGTIQKSKEGLTKQDLVEATRRNSEGDGDGITVDRPKGVGFGSYRMSLAAPVAERACLPGNIPTSERGQAVEPTKPIQTGSSKAGERSDRTRDQSHNHPSMPDKAHSHKKHKKDRKRKHHHGSSSGEEEEEVKAKKKKKEKKHKHKHEHRHHRRHRHDSHSD